ncbi:MAG TPA: GNAT family N-acetyltransferase [Thermomicrobiales bacterium]|jgi:RimJ/RimL family protein N-acetyltransferase
MAYIFRPPTEADARVILGWRYPRIYAAYNANPSRVSEGIASLLDPANAYLAIFDAADTLCGFCCFGAEARVPGGEYTEPPALDVGLGMRPDLTGAGRGLEFFQAILAEGARRYAPPRFRLTVATFNERARRVYERAGFRPMVTFRRGGERDALEFLLMLGPPLQEEAKRDS